MFNVFQKSGYLNDIYQYKLLADFTSETIFNNLNTDSIKNLEEQYGYSKLTTQNNTENFYNSQYSSHLSKQSNFYLVITIFLLLIFHLAIRTCHGEFK